DAAALAAVTAHDAAVGGVRPQRGIATAGPPHAAHPRRAAACAPAPAGASRTRIASTLAVLQTAGGEQAAAHEGPAKGKCNGASAARHDGVENSEGGERLPSCDGERQDLDKPVAWSVMKLWMLGAAAALAAGALACGADGSSRLGSGSGAGDVGGVGGGLGGGF